VRGDSRCLADSAFGSPSRDARVESRELVRTHSCGALFVDWDTFRAVEIRAARR